MKEQVWDKLINITKKEVVPALGCTEPVSVALAAAIAAEKLTGDLKSVVAYVSPNLMKNGMGVGVPGTGMVGLPIAAAVGSIAGDAEAELEVLKNITDDDVESAKQFLDSGSVSVHVADISQALYAEVMVSNGIDTVSVTIADSHTQVVQIKENGITTYIRKTDKVSSCEEETDNLFEELSARDIYDFSVNVSVEDIEFIEKAKELNDALSQEGLSGHYGLQIGATFLRNVERGLLSGGLLTEVLARTSSASDARMDGVMKPAMSNSGSGNQGIAATMPVVVTADYLNSSREKTLRALIMANLMAIYIKSYQNKLSALCGATTASMGAAAGITYLMGGSYKQISYAVSSMIGDIAGIICDGAKTSCAMKVSSSAGAAVKASLMALDDIHVSGNEGIVADDVDTSIRNLSILANGSMIQTDVQILDIMVRKSA
ncbi:L-cysteine desulfidase family protein [Vibrio salinus]|uniref:L-cysteine desulfidase family protein n=1 Tax=Vibrio salinus TaxID=2899784 RepID=UPI001E2CC9CF|nr:L-serine ammonia-lyase, iron-sulfur-dependent, subunit alpha [Vibrio salinus]MCE0494599.1 L-serine ammonia-lyase, iron-sulfur-dependent, subunit alpha [Vibrio salinus]